MPRSPGKLREVDKSAIRLADVSIAERRVDRATGSVDVDAREAQPPLYRPLHAPQALHLLERDP